MNMNMKNKLWNVDAVYEEYEDMKKNGETETKRSSSNKLVACKLVKSQFLSHKQTRTQGTRRKIRRMNKHKQTQQREIEKQNNMTKSQRAHIGHQTYYKISISNEYQSSHSVSDPEPAAAERAYITISTKLNGERARERINNFKKWI